LTELLNFSRFAIRGRCKSAWIWCGELWRCYDIAVCALM